MSSPRRHEKIFLLASCALGLVFNPSPSSAQVVNGVFDPSKVMVAKDRAMEYEAVRQNLELAKEINRNIGVPPLPQPAAPPPVSTASIPPGPRVAVPPGPSYDQPLRRELEAGTPPAPMVKATPTMPASVIAKKLDPPPQVTVSEASLADAGLVKASSVAAGAPKKDGAPSADSPPAPGPDSAIAAAADVPPSRTSWLSFLGGKPRGKSDLPESDLPRVEVAAADLPPGSKKSNKTSTESLMAKEDQTISDLTKKIEELERVLAEKEGQPYGGGTVIDGIILPSRDGEEEMVVNTSRRNLFARRERTQDVTNKRIPITIYSNEGNPYSSDRFKAGPKFSPLFDDVALASLAQQDGEAMKDLTKPGSAPTPGSGATELVSRTDKPATDTSQYWVVKKNLLAFQPFKYGTEEVDEANALDLSSGTVVRELGVKGSKRLVQIDSGERGFVAKDGVRPLSVSEQAVMAHGLREGHPWYSILDTAAE